MKAIFVALAALALPALSACGSLPENWPRPDEIGPYQSGASGLLVLDDMNRGCKDVKLEFQNAKGGVPYYRYVAVGQPGAIVVPPGNYRLIEIDCFTDDYEAFPNVVLWFDEVTVGAGEVVYAGSVQVDTVAVQKKSGLISQIVSFGFMGDKETDVFPVYSVKDNTEAVRQKLQTVSPEAAGKMITRLLPQVLSKDAVTKAYQNAYAAKPDGTAPTQEEVSARLKVEMDAAFETSIREYLARKNPAPTRMLQVAPSASE